MIGADVSGSTAQNYARFAREAASESPLYDHFGVGISGDADILSRLDQLPRPTRQPNLLFAAVAFVAGTPADYGSWLTGL